uniref:Uncharacterized protein n=1 Tax=Arundo donax TaxID=35708 RepID=A0A0A9E3Q6_ARUDO
MICCSSLLARLAINSYPFVKGCLNLYIFSVHLPSGVGHCRQKHIKDIILLEFL